MGASYGVWGSVVVQAQEDSRRAAVAVWGGCGRLESSGVRWSRPLTRGRGRRDAWVEERYVSGGPPSQPSPPPMIIVATSFPVSTCQPIPDRPTNLISRLWPGWVVFGWDARRGRSPAGSG